MYLRFHGGGMNLALDRTDSGRPCNFERKLLESKVLWCVGGEAHQCEGLRFRRFSLRCRYEQRIAPGVERRFCGQCFA